MAHQQDLTDSWPPPELISYLRAGPNEVSVSVLPRPRHEVHGGLVYLMEDDGFAKLASRAGIEIGYGGRRENDLGVAGEFAADVVAELAIAVTGGLTTEFIEAVVRSAMASMRHRLRGARELGDDARIRIGMVRMTADRFDSVIIEGSDDDEVGARMRDVLESWST